MLLASNTHSRPYISLSGPIRNEPNAVAMREINSAITASTEFMWTFSEIVVRAGAMMALTMMRLKPIAERTSSMACLRPDGQSFGLIEAKEGEKAT